MLRKVLTLAVSLSIATAGTLAASAAANAQAMPAEESVDGQRLVGASPIVYIWLAALIGAFAWTISDAGSDDDDDRDPLPPPAPPPPVSP